MVKASIASSAKPAASKTGKAPKTAAGKKTIAAAP